MTDKYSPPSHQDTKYYFFSVVSVFSVAIENLILCGKKLRLLPCGAIGGCL
jgi:hypothetical protein